LTERSSEPFDLDEDLFDFDEVARGSPAAGVDGDLEEIFDSFSARADSARTDSAADELLASSAPVADAVIAEPVLAPPPMPAERHELRARQTRAPPPVAAPEPEPVPALSRFPAVPAARADAGLAPAPRAAASGPRFSKGVVSIALAVTALNGLIALVMLRESTRTRGEVGAVGREVSAELKHAPESEPRPFEPPAQRLRPGEEFDVEAHPTLVEARAQIARGEYPAARQRIYSLLAIIDRLEDPRREAVESEAQFLLAQTLHFEALDRMGSSR
jgi:hypothetical protein